MFWFLLSMVMAVVPVWATDRYADHNVSTCGTYNPATRSCSGGSAQAYSTIVECLNATFAGDTCLIRGHGEFYGGADYTIETDQGDTVHSGSSWGNFVSVRGYQSERPMVRKIELTGSVHFVKFENLEIDGGGSEGDIVYVGAGAGDTWWINILVHHASNCPTCSGGVQWPSTGTGGNIIEFSQIYDNSLGSTDLGHKHGLYISSSNNIVRSNHIHDNSAYGIHVYVGLAGPVIAYDNQIYGNRVHNNGRDGGGNTAGILCGNTINCRVWNNLVYDEPNNGIQLGFDGCNANYILNNTVYNVAGAGIENNCAGTNTFANNVLVNSGGITTYQAPATLKTNYLGPDPGFVNPAAGDFTLTAGSRLINAGTCQPAYFIDDFNRAPRPQGNACDIGAYEFGGGTATPARLPVPLNFRIVLR